MSNNNEQPEQLSESQVWDVLAFAREAYNIYPNIFTPDLVNSRLKDVNMNPLAGTEQNINKALQDPKNNEYNLIGYSEFFEYTNMIYKRILGYLGNMLSFDYTYYPINIDESDLNSKLYKKDERILKDFLCKFDVRQEFKKVMRQLVRQEAFFSVLRKDGDKFVLQELPMNYCKITGRWENGLLFDFNMQWFINPGVDLNMYPSVFKKLYKRVTDAKQNGYYPSNAVDKRTGEWVYWTQTSPEDGFWGFKLNNEQMGLVPLLAPMFSDVIMTPIIRNLQKNKYIIEASKLITGTIPMLKENKSGNVSDMMAIKPETAGTFANLFRQALPEQILFGMAPFENIQTHEFKSSTYNLLEDHNKNLGATSGINSRLIYSLDKQNAIETNNSISVDEYLMTYMYPYFSSFMEYHINKLTKKYKFRFKFEGSEFFSSRENRRKAALELATNGIVLPQKFAAAMGMDIEEFETQLAMGRASGFVDKLTPLKNSFTTSKADQEKGRPQKSINELTENGITTRDAGSNIGKGGEI